jgi:hypothetical protein
LVPQSLLAAKIGQGSSYYNYGISRKIRYESRILAVGLAKYQIAMAKQKHDLKGELETALQLDSDDLFPGPLQDQTFVDDLVKRLIIQRESTWLIDKVQYKGLSGKVLDIAEFFRV